MELLETIKIELKNQLSEKRYIHSIGVMEMAEQLAKIYNVDVEKAKLAGLTHDIAKEMSAEESLKYIKDNNIEIDEIEKINTSLLHGKIGADIVKKRYGFSKEIQDAIKYHTTTDIKMDDLAKIIYVADKVEMNRKFKNYNIEEERKLAKENLDKAILYILNSNMGELLKKEKLIHPKSLETRNNIMIKFYY